MTIRGERAPESTSIAAPLLMGCAFLLLVLMGAGGAFFVWARRAIPDETYSTRPAYTPPPVTLAPPMLPSVVEPPVPDAPPPVLATDTATVDGSLSREVIQRVIRRHLAEVRRCYEHALQRDPGLTARVTAHFTIGTTGTVDAATVDGSSDVEMTTCIATHLRTWVFPAPSGGGVVQVNYPFIFSSAP